MTSRQRFPFAFVSITCLLALMLSLQTSSADEDDLIKEPGGFFSQKVIVSDNEVKLFPDGPGEGDGILVKAFSIFFKLKGSEGGYVRVGNSDGEETGWIDEKTVIDWNTRLLLLPNTPDPMGHTFTIKIPGGGTAKFKGSAGGPDQRVAAPILNPVDEGANPDYDVAFFAGTSTAIGAKKGPVGASPTSSKRRKAEIMFVIDTTASMEPLIEGAKEVASKVSALLEEGGGEAASYVRFGLVQYRDLTPGITFDGEPAQLETKLTDAAEFQLKVNMLQVADGGSVETKEDVLAGLLVAIEKADWSENSSKHIVLLGDASALLSGKKNSTDSTYAAIIGKAQSEGGSELDTRLGTIMFHAVQAEQGGLDDNLCKEQFQTLAANAGKSSGLFTEFDPRNDAEKNATIKKLHEFLGGFVSAIKKVRTGDTDGLEEDAKGPGVAAIAARAFYEIDQAAGGPEVKTVDRGVAKLRSEDGDLLARQMVLVSREDLQRLKSTLDLLEITLGKFADPTKRKDVGKLLEQLQEILILNLAGEDIEIDATTTLAGLVSNLPLRTDVLKTTALDLQKKNAVSYQKWIDDLVAAKTRTKSLLEDEKLDWHYLSELVENKEFAYILMDNMP